MPATSSQNYRRNQPLISQWIDQIQSSYLSKSQAKQSHSLCIDPICYHLHMCLFIEKTNNNITNNQENNGDDMWGKNEFYSQCLRDFCSDLVFYVYGRSQKRRAALPRCLIGYYELSKNIVHSLECLPANKNSKEENGLKMSKTKQKIKSSKTKGEAYFNENNVPIAIREQLKSFASQNMIRILLTQSPFHYIKESLVKLEDSVITQIFCKEFQTLLEARFEYFCLLFSIKFEKSYKKTLTSYLMAYLMESTNHNSEITIPVDLFLLSLIYAIYRKNGYKILFSNLVQVYQQKCQSFVNKEQLLDFYNEVIIIRFLPIELLSKIEVSQPKSNPNEISLEVSQISMRVSGNHQSVINSSFRIHCEKNQQKNSFQDIFE